MGLPRDSCLRQYLHLSRSVSHRVQRPLELDTWSVDVLGPHRAVRLAEVDMVALLGRRSTVGIYVCSAGAGRHSADASRFSCLSGPRSQRAHRIGLLSWAARILLVKLASV